MSMWRRGSMSCFAVILEHRLMLLATSIICDLVWQPTLSTVSSVKIFCLSRENEPQFLTTPNFLRAGAVCNTLTCVWYVCVWCMGATRSFTTRVPGGYTRTCTTRHRVRVRCKTRRVFRVGYPGTRAPVQQRVPVVSMPENNLQKPCKHQQTNQRNTRTIPTRYYACSYYGHP